MSWTNRDLVGVFSSEDPTTAFLNHASGKRVSTDTVMVTAIKKEYPQLEVVIAPDEGLLNLLSFASAGHASFVPLTGGRPSKDEAPKPSSIYWTHYMPPVRRIDGQQGVLLNEVVFGKFLYTWQEHEFILYIVDSRDGTSSYPKMSINYLLTTDKAKANGLIIAAGLWNNELHGEVWVFDRGYWDKSRELYQSVMKSSWDAVILDPDMKKTIINDHLSFFDSRDTYTNLQVPWKRGLIYHGPPGNGKTISIKAMMHTFYTRKDPIPTLYVRSFTSYGGPEYAISMIFTKARQFAPCYLVFEDLDSLVTDFVRSYFLNEMDGLKSNDGIFIVGSTNHLERLDPGISKRPSRFDRKYYFPDPIFDERVAYCKFWQSKLASNKSVEFPDELCKAIADITDGFSFAYMQEAFVAALLAIARDSNADAHANYGDEEDNWVDLSTAHGDLDDNKLWEAIQIQIQILRDGMEEKA